MGKEPLVLTFDIGTQSARAMLVNPQGEIVSIFQKSYEKPYYSSHAGWAEQKPEFYWDVICAVSQGLKNQSGTRWDQMIAVTCTTIRDTTLCLDAAGNPVRDVLLWLDKREAQDLDPIPPVNSLMFRLAGLSTSTKLIRRASHCNWVRKNQPGIWEKTKHFVLISAYFNLKFCGKLVDSVANTIGHLPFDVKIGSWCKPSDPKSALFDVEPEKLCPLVPAGTEIGTITAQAAADTGIPAGMPYIVTGSDKGCETLGLSCLHEDSAALSFGTIATLQVTTDRYFEAMPFIPPYPAVVGKYNPEIETYRGYWLISWFKREFAAKEMVEAKAQGCSPEDLLNRRLQEIPPGCDGLILQPTFTPDPVTPFAKGAIIGFSDVHTRIHIYRAIIEGINFNLIQGLRQIEKRGKLKINKLFVAGGGSRSDEICQITANMFGLPVYRTQTHEASGIGSSLVAFVSKGIFKDSDEAAASMIQIKDEFLPDQREHKIYTALYERIYCKIFDNLAPLYRELSDILASDI